jgi:hypothetical protein
MSGWTEILAGDPAAAERDLRWGVEKLREIGELNWLSTTAAMLSEALYEQGRLEEAERFVKVSQDAAGSEDIFSQVLLRTVRAKVMGGLERPNDSELLPSRCQATHSCSKRKPLPLSARSWESRTGRGKVKRHSPKRCARATRKDMWQARSGLGAFGRRHDRSPSVDANCP